MLRTATSAVLLGSCLAFVAVTPVLGAVPGEGAWMYGLTDNFADTYEIYQLNPLLEEQEMVYQTNFKSANAMAFDTVRDQLLFLVEDPVSDAGCWVFDVKTQTLTKVVTLADMGYTDSIPSNAAYYDDAFWSISSGILTKVKFTYDSDGLPNGVAAGFPVTYTLGESIGGSDIAIDVPNAILYGCSIVFSIDLSPANLANNPVPVTIVGGTGGAQCAFNADYTILYGVGSDGDMLTIDVQTGSKTPTGWQIGNYIDLGGSSFFGTAGPSGDCYATVHAKTPKAAKRGGYLRYRAFVKNGNKTISSLNNVRVEVTVPAELSIVSSRTSLKRQGVVGAADNGVFAWEGFNLTRHKNARFYLRARVSTATTKGQLLTLNTTVFHDVAVCPTTTSTVRIR